MAVSARSLSRTKSERRTIPQLAKILANRRWIRRERPYPHVVARNVFTPAFYSALEAEFYMLLAKGLSECPNSARMSRTIAGYDAYGIGFGQFSEGPFALFGFEPWHDMLAGLFDVRATGHVNIGAHHHRAGGLAGWIHNDFNPVWFPVIESASRIQHPDHSLCIYKTGTGPLQRAQKVEVVRAVAMIFYLCNPGWKEGYGGETGVFSSAAPDTQPSYRIAPENNSVFVFECTPQSYHSFLANPGMARNSIIMWIHRSMQDATARWPERQLERFKE